MYLPNSGTKVESGHWNRDKLTIATLEDEPGGSLFCRGITCLNSFHSKAVRSNLQQGNPEWAKRTPIKLPNLLSPMFAFRQQVKLSGMERIDTRY